MRDGQKQLITLLTESEGSPQIAGNLENIELIAEGGMAHIYRARQKTLDRFVVIKQLKNPEQNELAERFRREARTLASVLHQNVAHVYDFVENPSHHYIFMEYISGADLSAILKQSGKLPPFVAAAILLGVARGVSALHAHQLIHRDIKPTNIRVTDRGQVKLMDLGIVYDSKADELTRPGVLVGSRYYLSPEQVLGESVDGRSDLFLLGICLYEMLTGTRPFQDQGRESVFQRIRAGKYTPIRKMRSAVPRQLEAIVDRCLKASPSERFGSAIELVQELENFLGPYRVSQTSDLILRYLDSEALLNPTIPIVGSSVFETQKWKVTVKKIALVAGILLAGMAAGWTIHSHFGNDPKTPPTYQAPKQIH